MLNKRQLHYLILANIFCALLFLFLILQVKLGGPILEFDHALADGLRLSDNHFLSSFFSRITVIMDALPFILLSVLLSVLLIYQRRNRELFVFFLSAFVGVLGAVLIKALVGRVRPYASLVSDSGFSFPSSHAAAAVILFSMIIYAFSPDIKDLLSRNIFISSNIALIALVGLSRIYLRAHYFSDVIAGFSFGFFCFSLFLILKEKNFDKKLCSSF